MNDAGIGFVTKKHATLGGSPFPAAVGVLVLRSYDLVACSGRRQIIICPVATTRRSNLCRVTQHKGPSKARY